MEGQINPQIHRAMPITPYEKAVELAFLFCDETDVTKPNRRSIKNAIKCVQQIIKARHATGGVILDGEYWKEVEQELKQML